MKLGRLDEAEKVARKAIAMDPTDGQAPAGRRLTSYSILGRILRAEGKNDDAGLYERIVKAVRLAEKADLYRDASLFPQALDLYKQSSDVFADAYCIHARLAITLIGEGKTAEALEEFKRAYELMPDSFGEIESLCMGCEATFESEQERHLARDVFEKMAKDTPDKPQVHYLLGEIYSEEGDPKLAIESYERAVHLDPHYFNAWKQIVQLADQGSSTPDQLREATLAVLDLDPMMLHGGYESVERFDDYAELWRVFAHTYASLPPGPKGPLYPLQKRNSDPWDESSFESWRTDWNMRAAMNLRKGPGGGFVTITEISEICSLRAGG
jgi:tetratricopeptide (TPR) repeat protein